MYHHWNFGPEMFGPLTIAFAENLHHMVYKFYKTEGPRL